MLYRVLAGHARPLVVVSHVYEHLHEAEAKAAAIRARHPRWLVEVEAIEAAQ